MIELDMLDILSGIDNGCPMSIRQGQLTEDAIRVSSRHPMNGQLCIYRLPDYRTVQNYSISLASDMGFNLMIPRSASGYYNSIPLIIDFGIEVADAVCRDLPTGPILKQFIKNPYFSNFREELRDCVARVCNSIGSSELKSLAESELRLRIKYVSDAVNHEKYIQYWRQYSNKALAQRDDLIASAISDIVHGYPGGFSPYKPTVKFLTEEEEERVKLFCT